MFKLFSKSGIVGVIEVILLLAVGLGATIYLSDWTTEGFSEYLVENEIEANVGDLEILGLKSAGEYTSILGVRNIGAATHNISYVMIGDEMCRVLNSKQVGNIQNLELNCNVDKLDSYDIDIVSNNGVYSKVVTVWEETTGGDEKIPLQVAFDFGSTCVDSVRAYGMGYTNNSHAEIPSSNNYTYSACISHDDYILGTSCSGNFVRLFSLAGVYNSPIYIDKNSVAPEPFEGYYSWQDVCVSSSGGVIDLIYSDFRPENRDYVCVGSFIRDDFNGAAIGGCSVYETKIWLDIN